MCVQAFGAEPTVECFDESIVRGFAGPREVQRDVALICPEIQVAGDKLVALVHPDRLLAIVRRRDDERTNAKAARSTACSVNWQLISNPREGGSMLARSETIVSTSLSFNPGFLLR